MPSANGFPQYMFFRRTNIRMTCCIDCHNMTRISGAHCVFHFSARVSAFNNSMQSYCVRNNLNLVCVLNLVNAGVYYALRGRIWC